jgi:D-tyrosyl-tRNA(Tyr) deacylase
MKAVVQRVSSASVTINQQVKASISKGFLVLLGIESTDSQEDMNWLVKKIVQMRIFSDEEGKFQYALKEVQGDILLISQFTLMASCKKGNRPSFTEAAPPSIAVPLYEQCIKLFEIELGKPIFTGLFGADMQVLLQNDGPVTIILDSKNKI